MTPTTEAQLKALNLPDETYQKIVAIVDEALSAKTKSRIDPIYFERFWTQYPKRDGANPKAPAKTKFENCVSRGINPEIIIAGARRYRETLGKDDGTKFVAQALTWLNQSRWQDYETSVQSLLKYESLETTSLDPTWTVARCKLAEQIGSDVFMAWFSTTKFVDINPPKVRLSVDTTFRKQYIESKFYRPILTAWQAANSAVQHVEFIVVK